MKIYIGHSTGFDYINELYRPIRNSTLNNEHQIVLPHEESKGLFNSKDFLKECDLMIAEVSYPSIGLGIEIGWADANKCPVICIYKKGQKITGALKAVTDKFIEYGSEEEMIVLLDKVIKEI
ncbi:MAG: hypothetical protein WCV92_01765 [Candidatus Buchananbacteria bacterium]|jgi:hypothetical protein